MASCGIANGAVNLFVILLISRMNSAVMFPILSASEIVLTWLISHFFCKEKLSSKQNAAMLLGVASVVLMNL
jgi:multidrug transporter EmrE-like cation transporter